MYHLEDLLSSTKDGLVLHLFLRLRTGETTASQTDDVSASLAMYVPSGLEKGS